MELLSGRRFCARWDDAVEICTRMLGSPGISPVNQLNPLCMLGAIPVCPAMSVGYRRKAA